MNIYTTLGATATSSAIYVYDKENGIDNKKLKKIGITSLVSTASATVGRVINYQTEKKIHNEYANAYVESMSDAELERALIALGELESSECVNDTAKTI